MSVRKAVCGLLIAGSLALIWLASRIADHHSRSVVTLGDGDLLAYTGFGVAGPTIFTALLVGWHWNGILGDKRKTIFRLYLIALGVFVLFLVGPIVAASALGEGDKWAASWRENVLLLVSVWNVVKALRSKEVREVNQ